MVFATFGCRTFDDGSTFLMADYSIDCESPEHLWYTAYASLMMLIWPFGVPGLYLFMVVRQHMVLTRIRAIEVAFEQQTRDGSILQKEAEAAIEREAAMFASSSEEVAQDTTCACGSVPTSTGAAENSDAEASNAEASNAEAGNADSSHVEESDTPEVVTDEGGVVLEQATEYLNAHVQEMFNVEGPPDGSERRALALAKWEEMQPVLGIELGRSDRVCGAAVGRVVWPTYELVPWLLPDSSYRLIGADPSDLDVGSHRERHEDEDLVLQRLAQVWSDARLRRVEALLSDLMSEQGRAKLRREAQEEISKLRQTLTKSMASHARGQTRDTMPHAPTPGPGAASGFGLLSKYTHACVSVCPDHDRCLRQSWKTSWLAGLTGEVKRTLWEQGQRRDTFASSRWRKRGARPRRGAQPSVCCAR